MKRLYIVLTKSTTLLSKIILKSTHEQYTHASISLSDTLQPMYSFGRKIGILPLPAGLKQEPFDKGFYRYYSNSDVGVYSLEVSGDGYNRVVNYVEKMYQKRWQWRFSTIGLLLCKMGIDRKRFHRYFCSQFVAEALEISGEIDIKKPATLYHPVDFLQLDGIQCLYKGKISDLIGMSF